MKVMLKGITGEINTPVYREAARLVAEEEREADTDTEMADDEDAINGPQRKRPRVSLWFIKLF